jgi:hypothetical protein
VVGGFVAQHVQLPQPVVPRPVDHAEFDGEVENLAAAEIFHVGNRLLATER